MQASTDEHHSVLLRYTLAGALALCFSLNFRPLHVGAAKFYRRLVLPTHRQDGQQKMRCRCPDAHLFPPLAADRCPHHTPSPHALTTCPHHTRSPRALTPRAHSAPVLRPDARRPPWLRRLSNLPGLMVIIVQMGTTALMLVIATAPMLPYQLLLAEASLSMLQVFWLHVLAKVESSLSTSVWSPLIFPASHYGPTSP